MADVDVPGVGKIDKKYVVYGGAAVVVIVGYAWYRRATAPPTVGVDEVLLDSGPAEFDSPYADATSGPITGSGQTAYGNYYTGHPDDLPPTTNALWSQRATTQLSLLGFGSELTASAIGKYLARQPLLPDELRLIQIAVAFMGPPPVGDFPITAGATPPVPAPPTSPAPIPAPNIPGSGELWDVWQAGQLAAGRTGHFGTVSAKPGESDWGVIARSFLGPNATRSDVYFKAQQLQKLNPEVHKKYPFFVPAFVAASLERG